MTQDTDAWKAALANKRDLDRLERAAGTINPVFAYTDGLPCAQSAAMFDFVLVDYGNADATIYPTEDAAACDIASGEIGGVVRVYRVTFDVPPRDISGDIAEKAWAKMASGYEEDDRDRIPEFIEQNMDIDGAIEELMAERALEADHVRHVRGMFR